MFDGLDIVAEQESAIDGKFRQCNPSRRGDRRYRGCPLRVECDENQRRGGGACCETMVVVACGGQERIL
jgi:hypothetical protein